MECVFDKGFIDEIFWEYQIVCAEGMFDDY